MDIAVIGGGAAGMMAACTAAQHGARVTLLERNRFLGVKLNITGKGRCNLTNNCGVRELIAAVPGNGRFLYSAFSGFDTQDVMRFFEEQGVPLKTERGNRVFPESDRAKDVSGALIRCMRQRGVRVVHARALDLPVENGRLAGVEMSDGLIPAARVILATGGVSYPRTGSDGDGHRMARRLGHTVTPLRPSLVPLVSPDPVCGRLEGLSLRNVGLRAERGGKVIYDDFGEMLFTGQGVSGPMVLSASAHLARSGDFDCRLVIDLKPALDREALDKRVLRDFSEAPNRDFSNVLQKLLPQKLIPVVVERSGIDGGQKVNGITRAQRERLCSVVKGLDIPISGPGDFSEAVITAGGVDVSEIDPKTLRSKLVPNLYFAGEIMDVDAYTGGFNLQIAWSTGYKAGMSAALDPEEDGIAHEVCKYSD